MKNKLAVILTIVTGVVMLVSGFAKAADASYFSNILWHTYHAQWIAMSAPLLIVAEIALGALLVIQVRQRWVAALSAVFLVVVTGGYLYGVAVYGMQDCGCFGHLSFLNLSPVFTVGRNALMVAAWVYVAIRGNDGWNIRVLPVVLAGLCLLVAGLLTGYTFCGSTVLFMRGMAWQGKAVHETPLAELGLSPDSTYMVFAFSFDCPFCMNAVGNVSWYGRTGMVDRVIGLAPEDSVGERVFRNFYREEPFPVTTMPLERLARMAPEMPMAYVIRQDTIRMAWKGEVPTAFFFQNWFRQK